MRMISDQGFELSDKIEDYERKAALFSYAAHLKEASCTDQIAISIALEEVSSRCANPLDEDEAASIASSAIKYVNHKTKEKFAHDAFGNMLICCQYACILEGSLMIWDGSGYQAGRDKVARIASGMWPFLKRNDICELMSYLINCAPEVDAPDSRYIAFHNCILDLYSGETLLSTPELRVPNLIPHNWNPDATCASVDNALRQWACGRDDVKAALEEVLGLCLYRGREFQTGVFLMGEGANGKSTFLNMLMDALGPENASSLDVWSLGERFQSNALAGRLANIGDDISNERLSGKTLAVVKKVTAGNWVSAEVKGGETYKFRPYATCVFSCNQMPRLADNSIGMYRRFRIIPFDARFQAGSRPSGSLLEQELSTEEALQRAIVLGVTALRKAIDRGCLMPISGQEQLIDVIRKDNSSVYQFACEELEHKTPDAMNIQGVPTAELYKWYEWYCDESGLKPVSRNKFSEEMCVLYDVRTEKKRINANGEQRQMAVFALKN